MVRPVRPAHSSTASGSHTLPAEMTAVGRGEGDHDPLATMTH
jgi:hypothetical protein